MIAEKSVGAHPDAGNGWLIERIIGPNRLPVNCIDGID
jgi:hypothetical protein